MKSRKLINLYKESFQIRLFEKKRPSLSARRNSCNDTSAVKFAPFPRRGTGIAQSPLYMDRKLNRTHGAQNLIRNC